MKRVMVFGVFDLLHPGHLSFLYQSRREGQELLVVIARDAVARRLKGRRPIWSERKRAAAVRATGLATRAILGDKREGGYEVVKKHRPDLICLGYDQRRLAADLRRRIRAGELPRADLRILRPYKPVLFHTSLRRKAG